MQRSIQLMKSKGKWLAAALLVCMLAWLPLKASADTDALEIRGDTSYTVPSEGGRVQVHVEMELVNHDATTRQKSSGRIYFYDRISLPVPKSTRDIEATRANGKKLKVRRDRSQRQFDVITVLLGKRLFYNQQMSLVLDYHLAEAPDPINYVTRNVARFSAFLVGDNGQISAKIPADYHISLDSDACDLKAADDWQHIVCEPFSERGAHAFSVEAVRPTVSRTLTSPPIQLQKQTIRLEVSYSDGEEAWANKVVDVLSKALPILEEVMGFPYDGPEVLKVAQTSSGVLEGYAGRYEQGLIRVKAGASRELITHEGAHIWSAPFLERWLVEGWAEWAARETMRRMNMRPESPYPRLKDLRQADLPLSEWDFNPDIRGSVEQMRETYGYTKSVRLVALLVKRVGLQELQAINRSFLPEADAELGWADSDAYYEALTASGTDVDDLWAEFVEQ
ncbi:MAG: hypothetical protein J5I90_00625 [Caldilineales bacterium]|nr:hypothetical protein [Caldilineales bacterium]